MHELTDIGVDIADPPAGDYTTVAGMVMVILGDIPEQPGDQVAIGGWTIEVTPGRPSRHHRGAPEAAT